jgi:hypothetical protein
MNSKIQFLTCCLVCLILLGACEKKYDYKATYNTDLSGQTNIKVFLSTLNATRNYVYIGTTPLTGTTISYSGTSVFPAGSAYSSVPSGSINLIIKDTLSTTTQVPLNFTANFETGKFYSIFTYDTLTATKYKVVTDEIVVPTDTSIRFRFANFFYSSTPITGVDVFSWKANAKIATNVLTNDVTSFVTHPFRSDTLYVRATGTTSPDLVKLFYSGFTSQRSYTAVMRGRYLNSGTQAVPRTLTIYNTY